MILLQIFAIDAPSYGSGISAPQQDTIPIPTNDYYITMRSAITASRTFMRDPESNGGGA